MMRVLKFAAIDIGSNAVRLLLANVIEDGSEVTISKSSLVRMPLRLGEDAFGSGAISDVRSEKLVKTMQAYQNLMEVEDTVMYRACATSAMREASNAKQLVERVKAVTGIDIEIIDGRREAEIIYSNGIAEMQNQPVPFLYVDVGGGSTELTLFEQGKAVTSRSFDIGTIRMLKGTTTKADFSVLKEWLKKLALKERSPMLIGSGGNINKLNKIARKGERKPLKYSEIRSLYKYIKSFSYDERLKLLKMNPDRADVIIPATKIYLKVMKWAGANEVIVPTIGLSDGIIRMLYREYRAKNQSL